MKKMAIITTHPIQYYAPVFKLLAQKIDLMVFYTWGETSMAKHDPGFGKTIEWDIDLLDGYNYQWVKNTSTDPGSHHFNGIVNPDLIRQINSWQPDAILIYGWSYKGHLDVMRHFKNKIPVYFRGDSTLLDEKPSFKNFLRSIYLKWVYKHIDIAFYVGLNNKAYFKKYGLKENQLVFSTHSVDNERFANNRSIEVAALRVSLKTKESDIVILFAGKFEPVKNLDLLLSAFINLNNPNVHLLLVGNGINESKLKTRALESAIANNIHFTDFKNQSYMPVIYQAADVFCLPSISETWGLSVNEAMACGKAVLVSDKVGCAVDLVKNEKNGFIFKHNSLEDLLLCLKKLTANKDLLINYGQASALMISSWNFTNIANAIEKQLISEKN